MNNDYQDIVKNDIPSVLKVAEALAREGSKDAEAVGFEDLLHPAIVASSLGQYRNGHLRDAVLNGVIAVLDLIRARILLGTLGSRTGFRYRQRHGLQPHPPAKTPPPLPLRRRHRSGQHERPSSAPDPPGRQAHRGDRLRPAAVRAVPARNPRQRCGPSSGGSVRLRQPGRPWADINTVTNQLATPGIEPPASLIEDIFLDQCFNAGNRVVEHYFDQPSFVLHSG